MVSWQAVGRNEEEGGVSFFVGIRFDIGLGALFVLDMVLGTLFSLFRLTFVISFLLFLPDLFKADLAAATRDLEQALFPYQYMPGQPFTSKHLIGSLVSF